MHCGEGNSIRRRHRPVGKPSTFHRCWRVISEDTKNAAVHEARGLRVLSSRRHSPGPRLLAEKCSLPSHGHGQDREKAPTIWVPRFPSLCCDHRSQGNGKRETSTKTAPSFQSLDDLGCLYPSKRRGGQGGSQCAGQVDPARRLPTSCPPAGLRSGIGALEEEK